MSMELRSIIECLLFSSPRGLAPGDIKSIIKNTAENSDEAWIKKLAATRERAIEKEIKSLSSEYEELKRSFQLRCVNGKWQFHSNQEFNPWLQVLLGRRQRPPRLTQPSLETLSIIAYRQPITRAGIEKIRGVSVDGVMGKLMERGLVEESGKSDLPGKPSLYATTELFLEYFGLGSLLDLPDSGMLKSINADPDTPLEAPPESLHKVTNPEELSEWGIENTIDLAPNEPPPEEEKDIGELEEDEEEEEFLEDEDEDEDAIEYASKAAVGLKEVSISATEDEILGKSNQETDSESVDDDNIADRDDNDCQEDHDPSGETDIEKVEENPADKETSMPKPFVVEEQEAEFKDTENEVEDSIDTPTESDPLIKQLISVSTDKGENTPLEATSQEPVEKPLDEDLGSDTETLIKEACEVESSEDVIDSEKEVAEVIIETESEPEPEPEIDHQVEVSESPDPTTEIEKESSESKTSVDSEILDVVETSVSDHAATLSEEPGVVNEFPDNKEQSYEQSEEIIQTAPAPSQSIWSKIRSAVNSIEDPTNPVHFITLCSKQLWQTLNTIGKKLMSWIKR